MALYVKPLDILHSICLPPCLRMGRAMYLARHLEKPTKDTATDNANRIPKTTHQNCENIAEKQPTNTNDGPSREIRFFPYVSWKLA